MGFKKYFNSILSWSFVFLIASCASVPSGHYILLKKKDNIEKISKEFKIPKWALLASNIGKKFKAGSWIFVPRNSGIFGSYNYSDSKLILRNSNFIWPVPSSRKISSKFGKRWGKKHEGIDIPAKRGTHILAIGDGITVYSGAGLGGYGNITVISHPNGLFSVYAHAQKNFTRKGQRVHRGQVIAKVGSTGRSTGPHLHFEIRLDSRAINPQVLISSSN